jgi:Rad3-related DNA helicase
MKKDILEYFPFDELGVPSIRKEQKYILKAMQESTAKFIIVDAPTGVGKSSIGVTYARWYAANHNPKDEKIKKGAHILTIQKLLQSQYMEDFGPKRSNVRPDAVRNIMSKSNYSCSHVDGNCAEGQTAREACKDKSTNPCIGNNCTYLKAKAQYADAVVSLTNFDYFITDTQLNPYSTTPKKQVLILDEAHETENKLMSFNSIDFNGRSIYALCGIHMPKNFKTPDEILVWCADEYLDALSKAKDRQENTVETLKNQGTEGRELKLAIDIYKSIKNREDSINMFIDNYDSENYVLTIMDEKEAYPTFTIKPVFVKEDGKKILFPYGSDKIVLMSATILDPEQLCDNLGIPIDQAEYIGVDCPFPKENREIHFTPVGKMTYKEIDKTLPKMVEAVKDILEHHKNEKGIIHTSSYKITKAIVEGVGDPRLKTHTTADRLQVLHEHEVSTEPTVLVSPSMMEGVNLKGDLSRFQIVTKIPYLSLADEQVKARLAIDQRWYQWKTCMSLIQSFGRSVRNASDYADTYVLDADFKTFYRRCKDIFPEWLNIIW